MGPNDLFDPRTVPASIVSAAGVRCVNGIIRRLQARRVDLIEVQEPESRFRVSNMVRVYNQAHLRRSLMFIAAAHHHVYSGSGLVALSMVRSLFEMVANFLDFESKLQALLSKGDLRSIHDFVKNRTFATRLMDLIEMTGTPDVQATNILTQIDKMNSIRPSARSDYDYLCEHTHPNAFGGTLYFAQYDLRADIVSFSDRGPAPEDDLKWVLVGGRLLGYLEEAIDRIETALQPLSAKGRAEMPLR